MKECRLLNGILYQRIEIKLWMLNIQRRKIKLTRLTDTKNLRFNGKAWIETKFNKRVIINKSGLLRQHRTCNSQSKAIQYLLTPLAKFQDAVRKVTTNKGRNTGITGLDNLEYLDISDTNVDDLSQYKTI